MRQYTNKEQTAKLMELGFEQPKNMLVKQKFDRSISSWVVIGGESGYSIGELIEMLPRTIKRYYDLSVLSTSQGWWVLYGLIGDGDMWSVEYEVYRSELIDAFYAMVVKIKEEGVI